MLDALELSTSAIGAPADGSGRAARFGAPNAIKNASLAFCPDFEVRVRRVESSDSRSSRSAMIVTANQPKYAALAAIGVGAP